MDGGVYARLTAPMGESYREAGPMPEAPLPESEGPQAHLATAVTPAAAHFSEGAWICPAEAMMPLALDTRADSDVLTDCISPE